MSNTFVQINDVLDALRNGKVCVVCREIKPYSEYYKNKGTKDGRQSRCRECCKENRKDYNHKYYDKQDSKEARERKQKIFTELIREKKNAPCTRCGEKYPHYVMDFHHRNPIEKFRKISGMNTYPVDAVLEEIDKCDIYCSNCHRNN